jgi:TyrR family helix-turn-helix protein
MDLTPSSPEHIRSLKQARNDFEARLVRDFYKRYPSSNRLAERLKISQSSANRLIKKYVGAAGSRLGSSSGCVEENLH